MFGFSSLSMLVPQALMGVGDGRAGLRPDAARASAAPAGFVAGLALALTPIAVAIARHNNPDMLLVLCCVGGAVGGRARRWRTGARAGSCSRRDDRAGFETKMAAALIVVPGLAAAWLWAAPARRLAPRAPALAGGPAMVVVGGAWPLLVALTPAGDGRGSPAPPTTRSGR